jgi:hypothetical protein
MSLLSRLPFSLDRSVRRTRTRKQGNRAIPTIDLLEDRQLLSGPTTYTVTNLNDNGPLPDEVFAPPVPTRRPDEDLHRERAAP